MAYRHGKSAETALSRYTLEHPPPALGINVQVLVFIREKVAPRFY
jgi:hypothetical protein